MSARAVQALTETAPTLAGDGLDIAGVRGVVPIVAAPTGQTFDGTGFMLGYYLPPSSAAWVRAPRTDVDLADFAGLAAAALPSIEVFVSTGRFQLVPNAVGLSGGSTVTTNYYCVDLEGRHA